MSDTLTQRFSDATDAWSQNLDLFADLIDHNLRQFADPRPQSPLEEYRGLCPVDEIYRFDTLRVFRYRQEHHDVRGRTPLVLIPSMINRAYIMDLMRGSSLAGFLVCQGVPTYLIDWGTPGPQHDHLSFGFYVDELTRLALDAVRRDAAADRVGLLGYCMGGTMALIHAALDPDRIDRLTLLAAPVGFHDDGVLSTWARGDRFPVDRLIGAIGHMDPLMLQTSFLLLKPLSQAQKYRNLYEGALDPKMRESFIHLERWLNDNVPVPGAAYREYVKLCYHDNALVTGRFDLGDREIDLSRVSCPILNVIAAKDHIVPPMSSRIVEKLVVGPVQEVLIDAGHIGVAMGRKAREMFTVVANFHDRSKAPSAMA